ncbi:MAG TPA: DNA recombination protein RmuC [Mycobacteriales bacterium]|jgi:DNA recombination protein RmuC
MTFLLALLALAAGAALGWSLGRGRAGAEVAAARTAAEYERAAAADKIALLERSEAALKESFQALSAQVLEANSRQFLDLARETLATQVTQAEGDLAKREQSFASMVDPVREMLDKVEGRLRELEVAREGAYRGLLAQVGEMRQTSAALQKETQSLVTALRKPQVRGSWGEMHLRRAVEMAGLTEHCDFAEQATATFEDGRVRPDLVVRLAGGKNVVVDAKVPLVAFLDAIEATDEDARAAHLRTHARHLRTHVEALAAKSYWQHFDPTPEFVVLFVPQDAVLDAALTHDKDLFEHAIARRVLLTTPTSLVGMLLTVAHTWKQEALAQNAREVCDLGRELYKRLSAMGGNVEKLGKALNRAVGAYNDTVGSLERSVLPQARRFRDLRVSDAALDELEALGEDTRLLTSPELVESAAAARPVTVVAPGAVADGADLDAELRRAAGLA